MKQIIPAIFILFILSSTGCQNADKKKRKSLEPVPYSVMQKSPLFTETNISFTLDSLDQQLYIKLKINSLKNFPFPVNNKYKDTLSRTAFRFDFYNNNKNIPSEYPALLKTMEWKSDTSSTSKFLSIVTDTIDLRTANELKIRVPFYAFHALKQGTQLIELNMSQNIFTNQNRFLRSAASGQAAYLFENIELLSGKIAFEINVPAIYKSTIYGEGLVLKNDSTFSPSRMDNTIWKSSYPDIYWAVLYPKDNYYAQTKYEVSTDRYTGRDTFYLYHYSINDTVGFGVFDHDNLSRDDVLGFWYGSLGVISKNELNKLSFDHVDDFNVRIRAAGKIN